MMTRLSLVTSIVAAAVAGLTAHAGPPYPIVTDRQAGPYSISIWTDPDATDDQTPGGQFWVVIEPLPPGSTLPAATRATVAVRPLDRQGPTMRAAAEPVRGNAGNQFAALVMDHEGPYAVAVTVTGPLGTAAVDAMADATYDQRPPPYMLAWYLLPFVLAGLLWGRLLVRRRRGH
jgi:hypothetical protein